MDKMFLLSTLQHIRLYDTINWIFLYEPSLDAQMF